MYGPMMQDPLFGPTMSALGFGAIGFSLFLLIIVIWSFAWKAIALWHAARNGQRLWFIVILLVNTVGILEIVYLAWFRKHRTHGSPALFPFITKWEKQIIGTRTNNRE